MRCSAATAGIYYLHQRESMKIKWWRWWIVPLILTILFEVGVAILLGFQVWARPYQLQFWLNLVILLIVGFFAFIPYRSK